jgi:probable HAF family extracellular repeat protein
MIAARTRMIRIFLRSTLVPATLALAAAFTLFSGDAPRAADSPGPYVLTDLGTLGGLSARAEDINEAGEIVGSSTNAAGQTRAFLWRDGSMTDLGALATTSEAFALNETGHVVGRSRTSTAQYHAVRWLGGTLTDLTPSSGTAYASGVNELGQIVGTNNGAKGFVWQNGILTELGDFGGGCSSANDIDDTGQIVGAACSTDVNPSGSPWRAALWHNGAVIDLGKLPGMDDSGATAINNLGQIVGFDWELGEDGNLHTRAVMWDHGTVTYLGSFGDSGISQAFDINDSGQIVGQSLTGAGSWKAFLWENGVMKKLGTLGGTTSQALAINSLGVIVGISTNANNRFRAFIWKNGTMRDLDPETATHSSAAVAISNTGWVTGYIRTLPDQGRFREPFRWKKRC